MPAVCRDMARKKCMATTPMAACCFEKELVLQSGLRHQSQASEVFATCRPTIASALASGGNGMPASLESIACCTARWFCRVHIASALMEWCHHQQRSSCRCRCRRRPTPLLLLATGGMSSFYCDVSQRSSAVSKMTNSVISSSWLTVTGGRNRHQVSVVRGERSLVDRDTQATDITSRRF